MEAALPTDPSPTTTRPPQSSLQSPHCHHWTRTVSQVVWSVIPFRSL